MKALLTSPPSEYEHASFYGNAVGALLAIGGVGAAIILIFFWR
ncbi:MAG: hypothetical protein NT003_03575 [Candidatus Magasanikbacteria bacterium]|nr:hypothetical protein [Candidatus Magasanikbacteria bacterium]